MGDSSPTQNFILSLQAVQEIMSTVICLTYVKNGLKSASAAATIVIKNLLDLLTNYVYLYICEPYSHCRKVYCSEIFLF